MSETPTLRCRWLRFGLSRAAVAIAALLTCSSPAFADDANAALPSSVTRPITSALSDSWTYEIRGARLVLRPRKQPIFVNLVGTEGRRPGETLDDFHRRHTVKFDYKLVLRFEPKLSFQQVCELVDENRDIHNGLLVLEKSPLAVSTKGDISFPSTPAGEVLSQRRDQLLKSFRSVPAGYLGGMSVFVEPTYLRYASFLSTADRQEAETVEKRIRDQLTPYTSDSINPPTD
jgi:hypothetical protein